MKFGVAFANILGWAGGPGAIEAARAAEATGFDSFWTIEHVIFPDKYESEYPYSPDGKMPAERSTSMPDPLIWLSYIASATTTLRLATGILILPQRNPVVLAKEVATLDALSGGRVTLGIGVGWLKEEFDALGIDWARRGDRTDDYIAAMRALWAADGASHHGEFASFDDVSSNPKPVANNIPVIIGGHSKAAARRAGRIGDGLFPGKGSIAQLTELFDIARQEAATAGRDPAALEFTAGSEAVFGSDPVGAVEELAAAGVHRVIVPSYMVMFPNAPDAMAAFAEKVIAPTASS